MLDVCDHPAPALERAANGALAGAKSREPLLEPTNPLLGILGTGGGVEEGLVEPRPVAPDAGHFLLETGAGLLVRLEGLLEGLQLLLTAGLLGGRRLDRGRHVRRRDLRHGGPGQPGEENENKQVTHGFPGSRPHDDSDSPRQS